MENPQESRESKITNSNRENRNQFACDEAANTGFYTWPLVVAGTLVAVILVAVVFGRVKCVVIVGQIEGVIDLGIC